MILKNFVKTTPTGPVDVCELQCDYNSERSFVVTQASREKLEARFNGKHYHNTSIYEMRKAGSVPSANK